MAPSEESTPAKQRVTATEPGSSWWLEDPVGSVVTGLIAPAAAVGVLASAILGITLAF